jgi:hypothetical protein
MVSDYKSISCSFFPEAHTDFNRKEYKKLYSALYLRLFKAFNILNKTHVTTERTLFPFGRILCALTQESHFFGKTVNVAI